MLGRLTADVRRLFFIQEEILKQDWRDPRLHVKKLTGRLPLFSFRVTRSYRVLFYFRAYDEIALFAIGGRKDIYRYLDT